VLTGQEDGASAPLKFYMDLVLVGGGGVIKICEINSESTSRIF
jgi:hypothetical protein